MAYIQDITVNIVDGAKPMAQKGFGLPLILGSPESSFGSQRWGFSKPVTPMSTTNLKNSNEKYTVSVKVNSITRTKEVSGKMAKSIGELINELNNNGGITDAIASFLQEDNGYIVIKAKNSSSNIEIEETVPAAATGLFNSLKDIQNKPEDPVPGTDQLEKYEEYSELSSMTPAYHNKHSEYLMAAAMFSQSPSPKKIAVYTRSSTQSITTALDYLKENHDGFYAVFIPEREKASLKEAGNWTNANEKFFFGCSAYGTDADALDERNCEREAYIIHDSPADFPECAWAGQNLPKTPGSITWKWKALNNQKACNFSVTELGKIRKKNGQAVTEIGGIIAVNEGKTTSGQFIDVIRGKDWIKARLIENLHRLFLNNDKIPMDNIGLAQVEGVIRSVLKQAGMNGIIARATTEEELKKSDDKEFMYSVYVPTRDEIPVNDRAARILNNVNFIYYLAGAIHAAEVNGKISV